MYLGIVLLEFQFQGLHCASPAFYKLENSENKIRLMHSILLFAFIAFLVYSIQYSLLDRNLSNKDTLYLTTCLLLYI